MRTSVELQELILEQLSHGPQGPYAVAAELKEPPYRVRGELQALKRQRLVAEHLNIDTHFFTLTASGVARMSGISYPQRLFA